MRIGDEMVVIEQLIKAAELKVLCARAADALEAGWPTDGELERDDIKLIAQLREAGK